MERLEIGQKQPIHETLEVLFSFGRLTESQQSQFKRVIYQPDVMFFVQQTLKNFQTYHKSDTDTFQQQRTSYLDSLITTFLQIVESHKVCPTEVPDFFDPEWCMNYFDYASAQGHIGGNTFISEGIKGCFVIKSTGIFAVATLFEIHGLDVDLYFSAATAMSGNEAKKIAEDVAKRGNKVIAVDEDGIDSLGATVATLLDI